MQAPEEVALGGPRRAGHSRTLDYPVNTSRLDGLARQRELDSARRADGRRALHFDDVTYRYGRHRAVDGLHLEVGGGEILALLGPNGAGKSTTISLLLGLLRPQAGRIEVLGTEPRKAVAAGRVGAMLQTGAGSGLPPSVKVETAIRLIQRLYRHPAPFDEVVERAGIEQLLGRQTHQLSGGQAQSVRFAVAIAGNPDLVFLDEPTAAMDVAGRRAFWAMIRRFGREGRTIVFATHILEEADQAAGRVVVVNHGRVVADGPGASLKAAVAARRVRFCCNEPQRSVLDGLEGVTDVEVGGRQVTLASLDADATVRALVGQKVEFSDLEVTGAALEDAFVALTDATEPVRS
jgi:ABC-2 type transport system ATP-binding protein